MPRPHGGLGRGLGALIPKADLSSTAAANTSTTNHQIADEKVGQSSEQSGRYVELPLDAIVVNHLQPRKSFEEAAVQELAESISQFGVLQPILVRPRSGEIPYELIAGERRWRASRLAGKESIPAVVRDSDEETSLVEALVENLHRRDLNPLEEAAAFQQLIDDFGVTHSEVASRMGKGRATISNSLRLLELTPEFQGPLINGEITSGHARALLACDPGQRSELLKRIVAESLSVRAAEKLAATSVGESKGRLQKRNDSPPLREASILETEQNLSDYLNTTVRVQMSAKKGEIKISFATLSDLSRIYDLIHQSQKDL